MTPYLMLAFDKSLFEEVSSSVNVKTSMDPMAARILLVDFFSTYQDLSDLLMRTHREMSDMFGV